MAHWGWEVPVVCTEGLPYPCIEVTEEVEHSNLPHGLYDLLLGDFPAGNLPFTWMLNFTTHRKKWKKKIYHFRGLRCSGRKSSYLHWLKMSRACGGWTMTTTKNQFILCSSLSPKLIARFIKPDSNFSSTCSLMPLGSTLLGSPGTKPTRVLKRILFFF